MTTYSDLEYLKLSKLQRFGYRFLFFFAGIPAWFKNVGIAIARFFKKLGLGIWNEIKDLVQTFKQGDWKTKTSYLVMGFGSCARGQWLRGILFFLFEAIFILYMVFWGGYWIGMLPSLGKDGPKEEYVAELDAYTTVYHDNSFKILLYGILSLFFIVAFIYTWRLNIKQNKISEEILKTGKPLKSGKQDLRSLIDDQFHKTLLALPTVGILVFTVMPIFFMIMVAFTNYSGATNNGYTNNLFHWVGWDNFNTLFNWNGSGSVAYQAAFGEILAWTLMWAFFATFSNYFLGMIVAMIINKKGIRFKKVWRTILVLTIAIPQFISLLYVSRMFADNGFIIKWMTDWGWVDGNFSFFGDKANPWVSRLMVILINIWIGIPYLMLIATGILMNIPEDLYESAKIDGANVWQQYTKITLPYMLFVTGPYLLTSFIGNMNNFNVIYLLTGGGPTNGAVSAASGSVGYTDLLITWLYKITMGANSEYYMASVIGILVFVVSAVISLIVYNFMPSNKHEEDYQ